MITADELRVTIESLQSLPPDTIARIASLCLERRFGAGQFLYRGGDDPDGLFFLLSGRVRVIREHRQGTRLLHSEKPGGVLGEIPMFGEMPYPATAMATESSRCAKLGRAAVERLLREDPEFARFAVRRLAIRAQSLLTRIDELTSATVTGRIAGFVVDRARCSTSRQFTLGLSQDALAAELGTAREVVVRGLAKLIAAGAIRRTGRARFTVEQPAILLAFANEQSIASDASSALKAQQKGKRDRAIE